MEESFRHCFLPEDKGSKFGFQIYCLLLFLSMLRHTPHHVCWVLRTYPDNIAKHRGFGYYGSQLYRVWSPPVLSPLIYVLMHTSLMLLLLLASLDLLPLRISAAVGFVLASIVVPQWAYSSLSSHMNLFVIHVFFQFAAGPSAALPASCIALTFTLTYLTSAVHKLVAAGDCLQPEVLKHYLYENIWLKPMGRWRGAVREWLLRLQSQYLLRAAMVGVLCFELAVPLGALLLPVTTTLLAVSFHGLNLVVFDLDFVSYFAITWAVVVADSLRAEQQQQIISGWQLWPNIAGLIKHNGCMISDSFHQEYLGTTACLVYTAVHLYALLRLQDLSFLPFSSMDVFSEAPTLFDKSWPIILTCLSPEHGELSCRAQFLTWQVEIALPDSYPIRSYVVTPREGFKTGNELLATIRSHHYVVVAAAACEEKTNALTSGQAQLVNFQSKETEIFANIVVSDALRNALRRTIDILRGGSPGDEWDPATIEALLMVARVSRDELSRCEPRSNIL